MIKRIISRQYDQLDDVCKQTLAEIDELSKSLPETDFTQRVEIDRIRELIASIEADIKTKRQNISRLEIRNKYQQLVDIYEQTREEVQLLEAFLGNSVSNKPGAKETNLQIIKDLNELNSTPEVETPQFNVAANAQRLDLTGATEQDQANENHYSHVLKKWQESLNKIDVSPKPVSLIPTPPTLPEEIEPEIPMPTPLPIVPVEPTPAPLPIDPVPAVLTIPSIPKIEETPLIPAIPKPIPVINDIPETPVPTLPTPLSISPLPTTPITPIVPEIATPLVPKLPEITPPSPLVPLTPEEPSLPEIPVISEIPAIPETLTPEITPPLPTPVLEVPVVPVAEQIIVSDEVVEKEKKKEKDKPKAEPKPKKEQKEKVEKTKPEKVKKAKKEKDYVYEYDPSTPPLTKAEKSAGMAINATFIFVLIFSVFFFIASSIMNADAVGESSDLFGISFVTMASNSMEPSVRGGSALIINRNADISELSDGDFVAFIRPNEAVVANQVHEIMSDFHGFGNHAYRLIGTNHAANGGIPMPDAELHTNDAFVGTVIASSFILGQLLQFGYHFTWMAALFVVALLAFLLLLKGGIAPKPKKIKVPKGDKNDTKAKKK